MFGMNKYYLARTTPPKLLYYGPNGNWNWPWVWNPKSKYWGNTGGAVNLGIMAGSSMPITDEEAEAIMETGVIPAGRAKMLEWEMPDPWDD